MKNLSLGVSQGKSFSIPASAVTETFGILAKRGVGKTHTAVCLVEEMDKIGAQVIVIDPLDVWWGLRSSADGKKEGLEFLLAGGEHADIPLNGSSGEVLADFLVESGVSAVLSTRHMSKNDQRHFVTMFAERLYFRKGEQSNRTPLHLVLDEADEWAPQNLGHGNQRMFGAIDTLVRRGRASGIGVTMISQRSAAINKDCLTQIEVLIALRTVSPQDRKAMEAWIEAHDVHNQRKTFLESLASLPVGTAWFWSPGWLDVFAKVQIRQRETFDSSATPKAGDKPVQPKKRAHIDIPTLSAQIQATIEEQKANDPKELKKQIADLKRQLNSQKPVDADPAIVERAVAKAVAERDKWWQGKVNKLTASMKLIRPYLANILKEVDSQLESPIEQAPTIAAQPKMLPARPASQPRPVVSRKPSTGDLSGPEQRILNALAWLETIGNTQPENAAVAFLAGYTVGGGGYNNPRGALRTKGLIEYTSNDRLSLTDEGRAAAEFPESDLTAEELQRRVLERLPGPEQKILRVAIAHYPNDVSNEDCAAEAGYTVGSGGYNNPRGRLRTLGLIEYSRAGYLIAKPFLFFD